MARVVLAMSGGVDSSVAASLLLEQGHDVVGVFMRHGRQVETACADSSAATNSLTLPVVSAAPTKGCCTAADAADARRVSDRLDIPFYALNFEQEFRRIIDYFVDEYTRGRTPNPCVVCNNWLKFGSLLEYADSIAADYIATGHYAQLQAHDHSAQAPELALRRGVDPGKDQSYVLFGIDRALLPRLMFPVGGFRKSEIRRRAHEIGLNVADKKDSQDICFVPEGDYAAFVRRQRGDVDLSGEIVTTDGQVVGRHEGIEGFTIGQRKGLRVAMGEPYFVVRLDHETRRVVIGKKEALARRNFTADQTNWLIDRPWEPFRCSVKIRYLSNPVEATVTPLPDGRMEVELDRPKNGVAPGQAAVCYKDDRVLGGGWIE